MNQNTGYPKKIAPFSKKNYSWSHYLCENDFYNKSEITSCFFFFLNIPYKGSICPPFLARQPLICLISAWYSNFFLYSIHCLLRIWLATSAFAFALTACLQELRIPSLNEVIIRWIKMSMKIVFNCYNRRCFHIFCNTTWLLISAPFWKKQCTCICVPSPNLCKVCLKKTWKYLTFVVSSYPHIPSWERE